MKMFDMGFALSSRHARPWAGHPRLTFVPARKTWMAGTSPAMTTSKQRLPLDIALYTALVNAPSMIRLVPEMRLATGLARNTTPAATSCAVPMRPVGFSDIAVL